MICALVLALPSSQKVYAEQPLLLGRPIAAYPTMVGLSCARIERVYLTGATHELRALGSSLGAQVIDPLITGKSVAAGVMASASSIKGLLAQEGKSLDLLVVLFAHAATITPQVVESGIGAMLADPAIDSAMSVSQSERWTPARALRIFPGGLLEPYLSRDTVFAFDIALDGTSGESNAWFPDMGATIVRAERIGKQDWLGRRVHAMRQYGAIPLDELWQIPAIESWLQAHQVDKLFRVRRTKWSHLYDSERAIISSLQLNNHASVLDIGGDLGGLGLALLERFGTRSYTALVSDATAAGEVKAIYPDARVLNADLGQAFRATGDGFDLVSALDVSDSPSFFETRIAAAFEHVMEGGSLVFSVRLTEGNTIKDPEKSYQLVGTGKGATARRQYVVYNVAEVIAALLPLRPTKISAFGYLGHPSTTAVTPLSEVCFAVFAVTRGVDDGPAVARFDLQLPYRYST